MIRGRDKLVELLVSGLTTLGCSFNYEQISKLLEYLDLILQENQKFNLTSITEPEEMVRKHFLDSLAALPFIEKLGNGLKAIDIGTGAGLPGIPLKIWRREDSITLLDATNKKISFLREVIRLLELEGVHCIHGRAEELARQEQHREKYDLVLSRAVAPLNVLVELCIPFLRVGGIFIAYKSRETNREVNEASKALDILGARVNEVREVNIYGVELDRKLVIMEKEHSTHHQYPRKSGIPKKRPIV
ncbi:MAG: 16S rRNA (guanine(527)-N(7))-methyltransferase RsmG [Bacillota bacterium]